MARDEVLRYVSFSCQQGFILQSTVEHARCTSGEFKPVRPFQDPPIAPLCTCECHKVKVVTPAPNGQRVP